MFIVLVSSRFFIFVKGKVHCGRFDRGESITDVRRQVVVVVVVGVVVNKGTSHFLFYLFMHWS